MVIVNPPEEELASTFAVYPFVEFSSTVYLISFPALNLSRLVNEPFQRLSAFRVRVLPVSTPSALSFTVTESGRMPSWLLLSFHTFSTGT